MATVQVRDVPDDVVEVIAAKARARRKSMSAYLRDLIAEDAKQELQRRELEQWEARLAETHARARAHRPARHTERHGRAGDS